MNKNRPLLPTVVLSIACACLVILGRTLPSESVLTLGPVSIPFTDFFFVISAGIGSLGSGLLTFVLVFIAEFIRFSGDMSLYAVSTYLIVVLLTASLSTAGWFKTVKKTIVGGLLTTAVLAFCWLLTFTVVLPEGALPNTLYKGTPYWQLLMMAFPETALAFAAVYLFYHKAPVHVRRLMANAWIYDPCEYAQLRKNQVLAQRITAFSMLETLILYVAALFCTNLLSAGAERTPFTLSYVLAKWQDNLRLALMMMCVGVPIAYLFNRFIMRNVVFPINQMSNYMDRYFAQQQETGSRHESPDLEIHTGDELETLAERDTLTGVYNRRRMNELLRYELSKRRTESNLVLLMYDIDHFKRVNDTFGHDTGDKVLKSLTDCVQGMVRSADTLSRWGGEEFLCLLTHTNIEQARIVAERIRKNVEQTSFGQVGRVTISIGITAALSTDTPDTLFARADKALYAAKHAGRNCTREA